MDSIFFKKYIHNGFQIVHKNLTNLVVGTICELNPRVKNYHEKTKIKWWIYV